MSEAVDPLLIHVGDCIEYVAPSPFERPEDFGLAHTTEGRPTRCGYVKVVYHHPYGIRCMVVTFPWEANGRLIESERISYSMGPPYDGDLVERWQIVRVVEPAGLAARPPPE